MFLKLNCWFCSHEMEVFTDILFHSMPILLLFNKKERKIVVKFQVIDLKCKTMKSKKLLSNI